MIIKMLFLYLLSLVFVMLSLIMLLNSIWPDTNKKELVRVYTPIGKFVCERENNNFVDVETSRSLEFHGSNYVVEILNGDNNQTPRVQYS